MLKNAVKSVLDQTYDDIEVLIIDDASSDGTREALEQLGDDKIRYFCLEENQGASVSRNVGISKAKGIYVAFLDDDDEWLPTKLERQMAQFEEKPDVGVVATGFFVRDTEKDSIIGSSGLKNSGSKQSGHVYHDFLKKNTINLSTVLVKRDCLGSDCRFDPELPTRNDWDMWLQLARKTLFDYVEEPLAILNTHGNRITYDSASSLAGRLGILEKYWDDIKSDKVTLSSHYRKIGSAYCQLGDMKKGRHFLRKSLSLHPFSLEGLIAFAVSYSDTTLYNRGIGAYRKLRYYYWEKRRRAHEGLHGNGIERR